MSIAVATKCLDGLLICADQQITGYGAKYNETKVWHIPLENGAVVLGYSGSPDTMKSILRHLGNSLNRQRKTLQEIENNLQEALDAAVPKSPRGNHMLLCGFSVDNEFCLLKSFDRSISPVPVWDLVGVGDASLTRYLGGIFLGSTIHLPFRRALPICAYIVAQAKKYVDGCGGPTDILLLAADGKVLEEKSSQIIDTFCTIAEQTLNSFLTSATEDITPDELRTLVDSFSKLLNVSAKGFEHYLAEAKL